MSERGPTLQDVLDAVSELRGELGEVRIGLGDVRGRLTERNAEAAHRATCANRGWGTRALGLRYRALQVEVAELKPTWPH